MNQDERDQFQEEFGTSNIDQICKLYAEAVTDRDQARAGVSQAQDALSAAETQIRSLQDSAGKRTSEEAELQKEIDRLNAELTESNQQRDRFQRQLGDSLVSQQAASRARSEMRASMIEGKDRSPLRGPLCGDGLADWLVLISATPDKTWQPGRIFSARSLRPSLDTLVRQGCVFVGFSDAMRTTVSKFAIKGDVDSILALEKAARGDSGDVEQVTQADEPATEAPSTAPG